MDPRERADALLSRARARGAFVVTPEDATSPMDSANTQQIPRAVVSEIDRSQDPDTTTKLSSSMIEAHDHPLAKPQPTTRMDRRGAQDTKPLPAQPDGEPRTEEFGGFLPTKKQTSGRSNLSRRLDGI
ncbi:hypothetical protein [Amycolatopsis anabasis]|uniref:hypothetical protein n=1 Tax=Amycolatopsis anabasis TaxID=1840409 RepID=UPI00131D78B6|nr:hypothetical protein [Amycolatopsis anabasis]